MQFRSNKKSDKDFADESLFDSYIRYFRAINGRTLKKYKGAPLDEDGNAITDTLCLFSHFLEAKITGFEMRDDNNNIIKPADFKNNKPSSIRAKSGHIDLIYTPDAQDAPADFSAEGFQYSVESDKVTEGEDAMMERAKAALNLAYLAKARGWQQVDFGHTQDPVERFMLIRACEHVGLSHQESVTQSAIDTEIGNWPKTDAAIIQAARDKVGNKMDDARLTIIAASAVFDGFLDTPDCDFSLNSEKTNAPQNDEPVHTEQIENPTPFAQAANGNSQAPQSKDNEETPAPEAIAAQKPAATGAGTQVLGI